MALQIPAPNTGKEYAIFFTAAERMVNRAFMNRWLAATLATAPALVIGTGSAAKVKLTNATNIILAGVPQTEIAAAVEAELAGTTLAAAEKCKWLVYITGGVITALQGPIISTTIVAEPELPSLPASSVCLGYVLVVNATNPFIPGTTLLSAAGVTDTFVDLMWPDSGPTALIEAGSA